MPPSFDHLAELEALLETGWHLDCTKEGVFTVWHPFDRGFPARNEVLKTVIEQATLLAAKLPVWAGQ
jgi:hypothetical protein